MRWRRSATSAARRAGGKATWTQWQRQFFCSGRSMNRISRLLLFALVAGATACVSPYGAPIRVIVPRGATFKVAADSMARAGLVSWPKLFRAYARITGGDRDIKPGTYLIKHGTPWPAIIGALNGGKGLGDTITISEGDFLPPNLPPLGETLHGSGKPGTAGGARPGEARPPPLSRPDL